MQSLDACQSPGQDVRLQIDLDVLGQDDFDLAGSAPTRQHHDGGHRPGDSMPVGHSLDHGSILVEAGQGQPVMPPRRKRKTSRSKKQPSFDDRHPKRRP